MRRAVELHGLGRPVRPQAHRHPPQAVRPPAPQRTGQRQPQDGGALPVSNYTSTIQVTADGSKAVVEWRGAFYRGFPNNDPPPDKNDEAAVRAVTGVYQSGLANLKALVEKK